MSRPWHEMTALQLGAAIGDGAIDPVELTDHFLDRIEAIDVERTIYLRPMPERARAEALAARARARAGRRLGPLDGVPVSWKDLVDAAGVPTTAGTPLSDRHPSRDAPLLARASRAGLVCLGKTNLPDFAYSGIGQNVHFGTPANPWDEAVPRAPGGSSSGTAVSIAKGLAPVGIGSDTGGSVRIPAAFNGLVGLKTTAGLLPLDGIVLLSPSFDTIGPLCRDAADANAMLAVLARRAAADLDGADIARATVLAPTTYVWEEFDPGVHATAGAALEALAQAGAKVVHAPVPEFQEAHELIARHGNVISAEGYALWGAAIEAHPEQVDPTIRARFATTRGTTPEGIEAVRLGLIEIARRYLARTAAFDAVVMPTVPIPPPALEDAVASTDAAVEIYALIPRHTRFGNFFGLCGLTQPCGLSGGLPVGLMWLAPPLEENRLLRLAAAAEPSLALLFG